MRRAKLGDVYAMHLPNGFKLFQWAYRVPKQGTYIRVFDGLYKTIPANIEQIVQGEHTYIIGFHISRAYRIGLVEFVENLPVPEKYQHPMHTIEFWTYELTEHFGVWIRPSCFDTSENRHKIYSFDDLNSITDLPEEFRNVKWMDCFISPDLLMFLFDYDFTFDNPRRHCPSYVLGEKAEEVLDGYQKRVNYLVEQDRAKRKSRN